MDQVGALQHRKTQHIGRLVALAPFAIERVHLGIAPAKSVNRNLKRSFRNIGATGDDYYFFGSKGLLVGTSRTRTARIIQSNRSDTRRYP